MIGLKDNIRNIFEQNTRLLRSLDKAIFCFRKQQYDRALNVVANSVGQMKETVEAVITDREYFNLVSTDTVLGMLSGILNAQKKKDFILLADLLELQMISFLCSVQELIIRKEEILFDEERYTANSKLLKEMGNGFGEVDFGTLVPSELLENGYRVEFTSCGLMTLAAENNGSEFYFHTNGRVYEEAMLLAGHWYNKGVKSYLVFGFGMGYHISELLELTTSMDEKADTLAKANVKKDNFREAMIEVYEADINVMKLACAFLDLDEILNCGRVKLHYDPDFTMLKNRLAVLQTEDAVCIHYPSFQNIRNNKGREMMESYIPWSKTIESC